MDLRRLKNIILYCSEIDEDISFLNDIKSKPPRNFKHLYRICCSSIVMAIVHISEFANDLTNEFKNKTDDQVPWETLIELKSEIKQRYLVIDENTMLGIVNNYVPGLLNFCKDVISKEGSHNNTHQKI